MTIIEIAKAQFPAWKESVDKINARARRLRFDGGITYTILGEKQRHGDFGGIEAQYKAYRVDVEIGVLHYQGWDVIAVINTDPQTGVTIKVPATKAVKLTPGATLKNVAKGTVKAPK